MDQLKPGPNNSSPLTPLGFLERAATVYGDCTSIIYNSVTYNWSETHRRCLQLASSIQSLGIRRSDVVSVLAPNIPAMYELQFAVPMAGAVLNNINTRLDSRTISVLLRHSESKLIFVDYESSSLILEALCLFPPNSPRPLLILINEVGQVLESPTTAVDFVSTYEDFVNKGRPDFEWVRPISEWDPIVLNYTSGTTSLPKGVVHCHRGILLATINCLMDWAVPRQPVYLWTLPMFHANGWCLPWGIAAMGGVNVCLRKFDTPSVFEAIRVHNVTHMCGAPVLLTMLTNSPDEKPLRNPVQFLTGGAPPPAAVLIRTEALGFVVSHEYGLTETASMVASCAWNPNWDKLSVDNRARMKARQGVRTLLMTAVDVVDPETGKSVKRDGSTLGEVVIRGGSLMLGYLKDPMGTSKCMKDGWFYSGDVAVMDPDGYLSIKDRSKDVIISGGENVSSVEVESVLYMHPAVNEAAVVARPDEFWGETPCAFVSLKEGIKVGPSEKEVVEYCRERMPHFMVPKTVKFLAELPKNSTGKIKKFELREEAKSMGPGRMSRL
ncbi:2-methylpropanoate--CoA ligase CCL4-like [Impatiens glandulifera]|uniref:2-methylpropanoate--CoA ligase CCL4-like n=1 Tax=Impatiens glandulifera TaxID=253017 RepID=UPI001FB137A2|nr:2-methylpropanoate--CoA ligase CCL4-like [Impatiens glandulifera]